MMQPQGKRKSPRKYTIQETIQVYTDWANHYLDKGNSKKHIQDLQRDVTDGVLLAEVIEAATNQKIPDICRKPKNSSQMLDNIRCSLSYLEALGVSVEGLNAKDVRDGNLKTILGLFYALSRYKQQQKQQLERRPEDMPRLPSPYNKSQSPSAGVVGVGGVVSGVGGGSSIPTPSRGLTKRPTESTTSSRSTSPAPATPPLSFIPTPRSSSTTDPIGSALRPRGLNSPYSTPPAETRNSMLEKLKVFHAKEKPKGASGCSNSKRTSSSSGFSSARSERSDSSTSLYGEVKTAVSSVPVQSQPLAVTSDSGSSPKSLARGLRNRLKGGVGSSSKRSSPKASRKADALSSSRPSPKPLHRPREVEASSSNADAQQQQSPPRVPTRADAPRDVATWSNGEASHEIPSRATPNRSSGEVVPPETTPRTVSLRNNGEIGSPSRARSIAVRISGEIGSPNAQRGIPVRTSAEIGLPIPSRLSSHRISADISNIARPSGLQSPPEVARPARETPVSPPPKETSPGEAQKMAEDASSIPKPMAAIKGQRTVALVSPMPSVNSDSNSMSESSHSNSTGQSNSSDSSVIYRPSGSESGSEGVKNVDKNNADDKDKDSKEDDGFSCINIQPMEPLLRGYNRPLITRVAPRAPVDMTGYLSDGEMLRNVALAPDSCDGYISEGGASLYARRLQAHRIIDSFECDPGCLSRGLDAKVSRPGEERLPIGSPTQGSQGSQGKRLGRVGTNGTVGSRSPSGKTPEQQQVQQQQQQPSPSHQQPQVVYRVVSSRVKKSDSSQQTDNTTYRAPSQSSQWKKYTDVGRVPELHREKYSDVPRVPELHRGKSDLEAVRPSSKSRGSSSHGRRLEKSADRSPGDKPREAPRKMAADNGVDKSGKGPKVRGVPQSFGYVKRPSPASGGVNKGETRTAQVSAVPRTKVKVSGGTQTCSELHHFKSYSLTGPTASQLSQSVRERLMLGSQSLPKPGSSEYAAWFRSPQRVRPSDGSLSDTTYSNYAELHNYYRGGDEGWRAMRTGPVGGEEGWRGSRTGIMEAESLESLSSLPAQLQHRASLTHARLMLHQRDSSPRMNRSNSIRSTKSEKMYPSMLERTEEHEPYYCLPLNASQPTSPTPSQVSQGTRFNSPLSPIQQSASSYGLSRTSLPYPNCQTMNKTSSKDDEVHGSSVSLVSTASSLYSTAEEKQAHEIRKLRRELMDAQEKVNTLTSQLTTNAHVVSAFEQSLANMTQRLQQLTSSAERKDCELLELRQAMEELAQQESASPTLGRRHTINSSAPVEGGGELARQLSADSVSSINSLSSACSHSSSNQSKKKKKKGWLRSSFSRAFSRSKKNKNGSVSDVEDFRGPSSDASAPSSPILNGHMPVHGLKNSQSSCALYNKEGAMDQVDELRRQLREKDLVLTDIRLEALSSAHQLESLKDTVLKMRNEMMNLKQDNDRLQRQVMSKSLSSSQTSLAQPGCERRYSMTDAGTTGNCELDGQRVLVSVLLGSHGSYEKYVEDGGTECVIAAIQVGNKTSWEMLDVSIRRAVKDYVNQVDSATSLGLSSDSAWSYHIGEVARSQESTELPDLLPCGYIVGDVRIRVCLKGALQSGSVDALAFETLIPKAIVQRYVSLLSDHRRIILCGPSGTGKSYLANKLAEFLVCRDDKESSAEAVATFNVDHKSSKELRQYLANVADQCENNAADLPSVIILDNLHHAASLGEVFNGFLNAKYAKCPYIIGTMNQATCSTTNLQLHHNFRWVLCANHMEPVKGFLGRYLRRRLLEAQYVSNGRNSDLCRIMEWIPNVWQHLNKFLETHSSSDVTIGPRLFLSCPSECAGSQVWFTDLWNYSVVPYLMEAVREGLQLYGRRAQWEDPALFICQTYPWTEHTVHGGASALLRLRPEDVGYNVQHGTGVGSSSVKSISSAQSDNEGDPLLNMLMRLQEAANYSSPQSNDSDSTSVDSHSSSQMDTSRIESTL